MLRSSQISDFMPYNLLQGRSQRGQGGNAPTTNPLCPPPPRQFSELSKSQRGVRENAMVFKHMTILISKAFTSDHLSHVCACAQGRRDLEAKEALPQAPPPRK